MQESRFIEEMLPLDLWLYIAKKLRGREFIRFRQVSIILSKDPIFQEEFEKNFSEVLRLWFTQGEASCVGPLAHDAKEVLRHCVELPLGENREAALVNIYNKLQRLVRVHVNESPLEVAIDNLRTLKNDNKNRLFFDVLCRAIESLIENGGPVLPLKKMVENEVSINSYLNYFGHAKTTVITMLFLLSVATACYSPSLIGGAMAIFGATVGIVMKNSTPSAREIKTNGFVSRQFLGHGSFWQCIENKKDKGSSELKLLALHAPRGLSVENSLKTLMLLMVILGAAYIALKYKVHRDTVADFAKNLQGLRK